MNKYLIIIIIVINLPIIVYLLKKTYTSKEDFIKSMEYEAKPDVISMFDGDILQDMKYEQKSRNFTFYMTIVLIIEFLIYKGIMLIMERFF